MISRNETAIPDLVTDIRTNQLSQDLTDDELKLISTFSEEISVQAGQVVLEAGQMQHAFYLIKTGTLDVVENGSKLISPKSQRVAGDFVGVLETTDTPLDTIIAIEPSILIKINVNKLFARNRYQSLQIKLLKKLVKQLNGDQELTKFQTKRYHFLGTLTIYLLCVLSLYTLSLGALKGIVLNSGVSTYVDIVLIGCFAYVMYLLMKKSKLSFETFGVSFKNWQKHVKESIMLTMPILLFFFVLKLALINLIPAFDDIPLFNPGAVLEGVGFSYSVFIGMVSIYILFSIVQEFIARAGLQSTLVEFLPNTKRKLWISIIVSNLLFAMAHSHIGTLFALVTFVPGLYWGWLFARQRSLVGVCVSHMLIGVWVIFILGFTQFIQ
ncbi:CPBP family glutamic-type intramembrane protease [Halalkalibacter akibai]|uniref:Cyclic nucleotide-binding domain-containing protein n=1 Tax=Halalkalibacter akibai (strain ATCC 43226 / DSM 21942 / CIP 109018 / JCM 9157 / 1139) TaxID=1236973 RepID=W4QYD9_HALA3|nr:CPBP family glutamic-type intramembrane protease [Halalkalibacter akibai]GAE37155.1 hypothetical protein JCM9157_4412 [Halalkalibacter akibai JCM 9157]